MDHSVQARRDGEWATATSTLMMIRSLGPINGIRSFAENVLGIQPDNHHAQWVLDNVHEPVATIQELAAVQPVSDELKKLHPGNTMSKIDLYHSLGRVNGFAEALMLGRMYGPNEAMRILADVLLKSDPEHPHAKWMIAKMGAQCQPRLGLDFGNVIKVFGQPITIEGLLPAVPAIRKLFGDHVYVISRVNNENGSILALQFLHDQKLFGPEGLVPDVSHVHFCIKREDKAPVAADLMLTHFVDDRTECLHHMKTVANQFALNPTEKQLAAFPANNMTVARNWVDLMPLLEASLEKKPNV